MMEVMLSSKTSVLASVTRRNIPEDGILHSHSRENLKFYTELTGWGLLPRRNVSPARYGLGFYIPGDGILHSHRHENLKPYKLVSCRLVISCRDNLGENLMGLFLFQY
jgi:hypothetical protein